MKSKPSSTLKRLRPDLKRKPSPRKQLEGCQYLHVPKNPLPIKKP